MSYSVDVNILVHASNETSPNHEAATRFMSGRTKDPDVFCLAWVTIMGYLRIATHPSIFPVPLRPDSALANITALLALPRVRVVTEGEDYRAFLDVYRTSSGIPGFVATLFQTHIWPQSCKQTECDASTPLMLTSLDSTSLRYETRSVVDFPIHMTGRARTFAHSDQV